MATNIQTATKTSSFLKNSSTSYSQKCFYRSCRSLLLFLPSQPVPGDHETLAVLLLAGTMWWTSGLQHPCIATSLREHLAFRLFFHWIKLSALVLGFKPLPTSDFRLLPLVAGN